MFYIWKCHTNQKCLSGKADSNLFSLSQNYTPAVYQAGLCFNWIWEETSHEWWFSSKQQCCCIVPLWLVFYVNSLPIVPLVSLLIIHLLMKLLYDSNITQNVNIQAAIIFRTQWVTLFLWSNTQLGWFSVYQHSGLFDMASVRPLQPCSRSPHSRVVGKAILHFRRAHGGAE